MPSAIKSNCCVAPVSPPWDFALDVPPPALQEGGCCRSPTSGCRWTLHARPHERGQELEPPFPSTVPSTAAHRHGTASRHPDFKVGTGEQHAGLAGCLRGKRLSSPGLPDTTLPPQRLPRRPGMPGMTAWAGLQGGTPEGR